MAVPGLLLEKSPGSPPTLLFIEVGAIVQTGSAEGVGVSVELTSRLCVRIQAVRLLRGVVQEELPKLAGEIAAVGALWGLVEPVSRAVLRGQWPGELHRGRVLREAEGLTISEDRGLRPAAAGEIRSTVAFGKAGTNIIGSSGRIENVAAGSCRHLVKEDSGGYDFAAVFRGGHRSVGHGCR